MLEERGRLAGELRTVGLEPLPSHANFLCVPVEDPDALAERLLQRGLPVRPVPGAIRITIRAQPDDDRLLDAVQSSL